MPGERSGIGVPTNGRHPPHLAPTTWRHPALRHQTKNAALEGRRRL